MGNEPNEPVEPNNQTEPPTEPAEPRITDKHGQEGISKGKYERDIAERDNQIADLQKQLAAATNDAEERAKIAAGLEEVKQKLADDRQTFELEKAGCIDIESAKAVIGNYQGDIAGLKESKPWLFQSDKPKGATGLKPVAPPSDGMDEKLDRAFGLI